MNEFYLFKDSHLHLFIWARPKSMKTQFDKIVEGEIKLKVKAQPADGLANKAIIKFLSKILKIEQKRIVIRRGELSAHKEILIGPLSEIEVKLLQSIVNNLETR